MHTFLLHSSTRLVLYALLAIGAGSAGVAQTTASGSWSNPQDGGAGSIYCLRTYDIGSEAVISYGSFALLDNVPPIITDWDERCDATGNVSDTPGSEGQSGLGILSESNVDFSTWVPNVAYRLAEFTHYNGRIETPENDDGLTGATLTIGLNGGGLNANFSFGVTYEETPNFENPCSYSETNGLCDDRVSFSNLIDNSNFVQIGLNTYTLEIEGFGACDVGPNQGDVEFITIERTKNSTCLWASLELFNTLPVEFTAFSGFEHEGGVELQWSVASETSNAGFAIEQASPGDAFREIAFVDGFGTTSETRDYSYSVQNAPSGINRFRLRQIDFDGQTTYSEEIKVSVELPGRMALYPAYPNPFNPQTTIRFAMTESQPVTLTLFNAMGQPVRDLFSGVPEANSIQQLTIDGQGFTSGSYIVRMSTNGRVTSQRITLLK